MHVPSLASLIGLRIQCCHELWWRSKMKSAPFFGGGGVWAGSCSSDWPPSRETPICRGGGPKKKKKKKNDKSVKEYVHETFSVSLKAITWTKGNLWDIRIKTPYGRTPTIRVSYQMNELTDEILSKGREKSERYSLLESHIWTVSVNCMGPCLGWITWPLENLVTQRILLNLTLLLY